MDIQKLRTTFMGKPMPSTGKLVVMETASSDQDIGVKFNKYSGVTEWANGCLLWVNVGGNDYANEFFEKVIPLRM